MPPHGGALPGAKTDSARAARQNFFCELCQKGYARMNEYEAHLGSYDHSHRQRAKDTKALLRNTNAATSKSSKDSSELQSISLMPKPAAAKKKAVFKAIGSSAPAAPVLDPEEVDPDGAVRNGWASERYGPHLVSGCVHSCGVCGGSGGGIAV